MTLYCTSLDDMYTFRAEVGQLWDTEKGACASCLFVLFLIAKITRDNQRCTRALIVMVKFAGLGKPNHKWLSFIGYANAQREIL